MCAFRCHFLVIVIMVESWSMAFVLPVITHNKVSANMQSAARQCAYSAYKHTHTHIHAHTHGTLGGSQQLVHFLPSVKAHLSQLLFWREDKAKKECASLSFPTSPSPFPAFSVALLPWLVYLIIPMVSYCSSSSHKPSFPKSHLSLISSYTLSFSTY